MLHPVNGTASARSKAGEGRQKIGILFKIAFFNLLGSWGKRKLREVILGRVTGDNVSPAVRKFWGVYRLNSQEYPAA
jgi:hypothetical protein